MLGKKVILAALVGAIFLAMATAEKDKSEDKKAQAKGGDMSDMMLMMLLSSGPAVSVMSPMALLAIGVIAATLNGLMLALPNSATEQASRASLLC